MKKKALALVLSLAMILNLTPVGTLALDAPVCGLEEHCHAESCLGDLVCAQEETPGHAHGTDCYGTLLLCGLAEDETHTHGDECQGTGLVCGQEEAPAHAHTQDCYALICGLPAHQHAAECYPTEPEETVPETTETTEPEETVPETTEPTEPEESVPETTEPSEPEETIPETTEPTEPEEPVEAAAEAEPACDCAYPPEKLPQHADSCPRKQYIKTLFEGKSAEEIYAAWPSYSEATQADLLDMLEAYRWTVYDALLSLLENDVEVPVESESETIRVQEGNSINASWDSTVFGGAEVSVISTVMTASEDLESTVTDVIRTHLGESTEILKLIPVDITFLNENGDHIQPEDGKFVSLDFSISTEQIPQDANKILILHICSDGTVEIVGEKYLDNDAQAQTVLIQADDFSTYVTGLVAEKYQATLLKDALEGNSRYTVRSLYEIAGVKVNLFDYDPFMFNEGKTVDNSFVFLGIDGWASVQNGGVNDSTASYANQGILQEYLNNAGIPVMAFGGLTTGSQLFNPYDMTAHTGRAVYPDVDFEFVYDTLTHHYIYSSAHNHAQLSDDNTKVQLYTDTLAVINKATRNIELLSGSSSISGTANDCTLSFSNNQVTGLINNTNGSRTDPYFNLNFEDFEPNAGDKVVIRIKFNFNADGQSFWLYFNRNVNGTVESANDERSLVAAYTGGKEVDGWYEYEIVLDSSENSYWSTYNIATFRIDPIDSQQGYEVGTGDQFVLESVNVIENADVSLNSNLNAGFYPFSKIEDSYVGQSDPVSIEDWGASIGKAEGTDYQQGSRAIYNGTTAGDDIDHLYLGLAAYLPFYLPENKLIDGEEIVYTFNGDDDLWVFIDGQLVLDIGGGHGAIKGTINFTTGEVVVSNAITVTSLTSGNWESAGESVKYFNFEPGEHVMQLFYMERAGSVSNCFMKFNFPLIPASAFTITKEVEKTAQTELYLPDSDEKYVFSLTATNPTHEDQTVDVSQWTYTLWGAGEEGLNTYSPVNGQITLKSGQTARFEGVDEHTVVTVTELTPEEMSGSCEYVYTTYSLNDDVAQSGNTVSLTTIAEGSQDVIFTNYYKDCFFDLTIQKTGWEAIDPDQTFLFHVECEETGVDLDVTILGNGQVTIKKLRFGEYTITENDTWSWRYTPESEIQVLVAKEETHTVVFENKRTEGKWLDGNSWCQNIFADGGVVPKKGEGDDEATE